MGVLTVAFVEIDVSTVQLSRQRNASIRCLEPLNEEHKDKEGEQLLTPAYHLCSDDLTENIAETSSSTSQTQESEPATTDPGEPLFLEDPSPTSRNVGQSVY